ncbi:MAG: DUF2520 domain-containing protein [Candidatus Kapabacteria bacterium]|nr:DUF2520 domain-containing protein [Candidatus Kapabacteria bacterium]
MISHVTIIGRGRVGGAIYNRLIESKVKTTVVRRDAFDAWCAGKDSIGDVLIIATKDDVLRSVVARIVEKRGNDLGGVLVLHVNGSLGSEILSPVQAVGALAAAAHPFQTFGNDDPSALDGIGWGVQCDDAAWSTTRSFVELVGGIPWLLTDVTHERKRRYHAAAVAASNFTYAAYELARRLAEDADIPADVFLIPIMQRTLRNASDALEQSRPFAITGPLMRGDIGGVHRQLESIPFEDRDLYRHLSLALLRVVGGGLDEETRKEMERLLG